MKADMRFIVMHKLDPHSEAGLPPSKELMAAVGKLIAEGAANGVFLSGEGLQPSSTRTRLTFSCGQCTKTEGPFSGSNELIAGFAMIQVKAKEEAVDWARRLGEVMGDVDIEVGQVKDPWHLGMCPEPEGAPMRFLLLRKAGAASEAGAPMTPEQSAGLAKLTEEMTKAGVFLLAQRLQPSSKGARLRVSAGKRSVIDGPFAESKELIGGYAIIQVNSKAEAIEWASCFAQVLFNANAEGVVEMDVLPLHQV